jgi:flavin-dependent dehydrogenase
LTVILIDARAYARRAPGESLHPGIEPLFKKLGVWNDVITAGFHRHRGIWREIEGSRTFAPYGSDSSEEWLGFQADRYTLQSILQRAASEAGAVFKPATSPSDVILHNDRIKGIACAGVEMRARWVFDATGPRAWLARKLKLRADHSGPPLRVSFGWKDDSDPCLEGQPLFRQHKGGWEWHAPLGNGRTAWTRLEQVVRRTKPEGVVHGLSGLDMTWRLHHLSAGPGYFLLGDAAALLDPASSNGVLRALMSGMLAADLAARVLRGDDERRAAHAYMSWIEAIYHHQRKSLRHLYC